MAETSHVPVSTLSSIASVTSNATSHLTALPADLAQFLANAASFAFIKVPERIEYIFHGSGSVIAEATGNESGRIMSSALSKTAASASTGSTTQGLSASASDTSIAGLHDLALNHVRSLGGFFTYLTSKWALATLVLVSIRGAIILNRTQIYASMRRNLHLRFPVRLALRLAPICLLLSQCAILLQALKCQTSPRFSEMKYGNAAKHIELDFAGDGGFLYRISSYMRFLESDEESCRAIGMTPPASGEWVNRRGSVALLWPLFQVFWLAHFVETIATVLQGRPIAHETGMSIFEHSLAFAEAEAALSSTLGLFSFRFLNPAGLPNPDTPILLQHLNTTPENLLIALISTMNNVSSQILGVLDLQSRFRLINTGAWGTCYLSILLWAFLNLRPEYGHKNVILRFPVVCIVGFTPHLLIVVGIVLCSLIYILALTLCFLSPPPEIVNLSFKQRLRWAFENMQAHVHLSNFRVEMRQDFYTALLQAGFMALTAASEAVFLNERRAVTVARWTWLEQQRLDDFESYFEVSKTHRPPMTTDKKSQSIDGHDKVWKSGYAHQKIHKISKAVPPEQRQGTQTDGSGVGAFRRARRAINAYFLMSGILQLISMWTKVLVGRSLDKMGIKYRPQWLQLPKSHDVPVDPPEARPTEGEKYLDFWMLSQDGVLSLPKDDDVDVEAETRRRLTLANENRRPPSPDQLNTHLYDWWKSGGWWGQKDGSGSYAPSALDDNEDTTSVISMSTNATDDDWLSDDGDDRSSGRRTPTQRNPHPAHSPSPTPSVDHALDPTHLASLLDPQSSASRQEAKMLAYHLTAPSITTRSRYTQAQSFANAKVLTSTRLRPDAGPLNPEDESRILEEMILSKRNEAAQRDAGGGAASGAGGDWRTGGAGMGQNGPMCVVCQSAPRTVLAWPCRCLSLCEECRVSLAMNNFGTCVCCRQEVGGFSRLFVP